MAKKAFIFEPEAQSHGVVEGNEIEEEEMEEDNLEGVAKYEGQKGKNW